MERTSRRNLLRAIAAGGATAAGIGGVLRTGLATNVAAQNPESHGHHEKPPDGPLASATVSFGQWSTDPPLDRFPNTSPGGRNVHLLIPYEPTIKAGGSINFVIAGLHHVQIFGDGHTPDDINTSLVTPMTAPPALPLINDAAGRIYRGLDPSLVPRDRVEVVQLTKPGRYLVICGFLFHFQDDMYGYIRVIP